MDGGQEVASGLERRRGDERSGGGREDEGGQEKVDHSDGSLPFHRLTNG